MSSYETFLVSPNNPYILTFWKTVIIFVFSNFEKIQHLARFSGLDLLISKILRQCEETSRKFLGVKIYVKYKLNRFFALEKKSGRKSWKFLKIIENLIHDFPT